MHSRATLALNVSTDIIKLGAVSLMILIAFRSLSISSFSLIGNDPGFEEQAPMSIILAPSK